MSQSVVAFDPRRAQSAQAEPVSPSGEKPANSPSLTLSVGRVAKPVAVEAPKDVVAEPTQAAQTAATVSTAAPVEMQSHEAPSIRERFSKSAQMRAELAAVYGGLIGVQIEPTDLLESVIDEARDTLSLSTLAKAFRARDLKITAMKGKLEQHVWPALAEMTTGQLVLVLEEDDDGLVIYDETRSDRCADVTREDFASVFSGRSLRAQETLAQVAEKHKTQSGSAHWFWGEFAKYKKYLFEIAAGSFVANLLAVAVALFSLQVYDRVIPHQSFATLWVLAIGAVGALLMEAFLKIARARMMDGAGREIEMGVQRTLINRLLGMRVGQEGATPSSTFSAMREFSSVREFFTASTVGSLTDVPFIFLFLLLVASIAGNVVWVLVLGGVLMVLPSLFLQKRMVRLTEETQGASVKANRLLHEAIYEADTLKAHRGEQRFARVWDELTALSATKSSEQRRLASALTFWSQGVQQATYVAAVVMGTFLVFAGEFTVGSIIAVGILTSRTLAPLTQLAGIMARWSNVKTALESLEAVVNSQQDLDETRTYMRRETLQGRYELRDLVHRYSEDGNPVLDIAGVSIPEKQHVALLGSNGSGKSTLLKLMTGLYEPNDGRIQVDGLDIDQLHPKDLRRGIGYLAQEVRLFAGTLRDNLNLSQLERDDARLMKALNFAGLGQFVSAHPKGLDLPIHDGGAGLSIGQRQSIGWARLWLQDPRIVLLDEPTAALDQTLEAALVGRMRSWLKGRTAVIATHRMPILELTDRVLILQNGKLAVDGPREAVLDHMRQSRQTRESA